MKTLALLAALVLASPAVGAALSGAKYSGTVTKVTDGDTVQVTVKPWANSPFDPVELRIQGIDTPETSKLHAKCEAEISLGKAASAYAKTLVKVGDPVTFVYRSMDKYGGRIDAELKLRDGRDYATLMLASGMARAYTGGTKSDWCAAPSK